ncbi:MAG TPA: nuclear transport factor 2 family protein [Myxococcales bacterium]|nr:nuclear transport factor 2 family protein [Myxococcales bacterium]
MRLGLCAALLVSCAHAGGGEGPDREAVARELDDFHDAAARADEERYFAHFAPGGVFLGTDATERWDVAAFRAYAHPYFAKGKAWSFRAARRFIAVRGEVAWFEEDLETQNLGPARGSGVLVRSGPRWLIEQYVLSIPIPNQRFKEVRELLTSPSRASP